MRRRRISARRARCAIWEKARRAGDACSMRWPRPRSTNPPRTCCSRRSRSEQKMNDAVQEGLAGQDTRALVAKFHDRLGAIRTQVRKIIVGQDDVVDHLVLTLLVGGHCLITGMPGT